jgi:hypothetical protein
MSCLLLVMRDQGIPPPPKVLSNPSLYPGERLWRYRPLRELLGTDGVDVHYGVTGKSMGLVRKLLMYVNGNLSFRPSTSIDSLPLLQRISQTIAPLGTVNDMCLVSYPVQ